MLRVAGLVWAHRHPRSRLRMKFNRDLYTPVVIGAFALMSLTGVLLFFHLDSPLNKAAHEWVSWALLAGVAGHVAANFSSLKRHLSGWRGRLVVGLFAGLLALSFAPVGGKSEPPFAPAVRTLARAPLASTAQLAGISEGEARQRLQAAGIAVAPGAATLEAAVGPQLRAQVRAINAVLGTNRRAPAS